MEFLDRQDELALLADHLERPGAGMFVLYGRRRIGKTLLLEKLLESRPRAAYHVGTRSTVVEEMARLSAALSEGWQLPFLQAQPLESSRALLALLEGIETPGVLALDEFPYLIESDPQLPGLLQASWDRCLSRRPIKLLLCGSSVSTMESTFFGRRSPLYGRRTGQLRLDPLAPQHLAAAFPWPAVELVELAAVFGGVPGYLQRLDPDLDVLSNLERHVLRRGEPLYEEVPFLLREELREPRVYQAILAVIAAGARKFGEISSKVGIDRSNLTQYLGILADLGLVEREVPVLERQPNKSRKGRYRICDPFVATWYAFVHPNRDSLERGRSAEVVRRAIRPRWPTYLGQVIEPILGSLFRSGPLASHVPFQVAHAGRAWSERAEFDLVLLDESRRRAFVAEIKWSSRPVAYSTLAALVARVAAEPTLAELETTCAVVSRSGFDGPKPRREDEERCIDVRALDRGGARRRARKRPRR